MQPKATSTNPTIFKSFKIYMYQFYLTNVAKATLANQVALAGSGKEEGGRDKRVSREGYLLTPLCPSLNSLT